MTVQLIPLAFTVRLFWKKSTEGLSRLTPEQGQSLQDHLDQYLGALYASLPPEITQEMENCFIHRQRSALRKLADGLIQNLEPEAARSLIKTVTVRNGGQVRQQLITFLQAADDLLNDHFPKAYEENARLSRLTWISLKNELLPKAHLLLEQLRTLGIDRSLVDLLTTCANQWLERDRPITDCQAAYMHRFYHKIYQVAKNPAAITDDAVADTLFEVNFNYRPFVEWYTRHLARVKDPDANDTDYEHFARIYHTVEHRWTDPMTGYHPDRPSIKSYLLWHLATLLKPLEPVPNERTKPLDAAPVRIKCTLSVPQIACLIRLMVDVGAIQHENQRELLRIFAGGLSSSRVSVISAESLRTKYYNIDRQTAEATRSLLLNMVHQSRKLIP